MKSPKFYFDAQPTYDYWIVNQHAQDGRIQRVVFRTANKSRSDRAADALNRAVEKFARRRSDLPGDRIQAVPHDGRRGGEAVVDLVDDEVYAEGLPHVEAEELAGAIWNVAHDIARVNARAKTSRSNPTCGHSARANPVKQWRTTASSEAGKSSVHTLAQARAEFRDGWLPPDPSDRPAVRLAWSMFVDMLHRGGRITDRQAQTWDIPKNFARPRKAASHRANPAVACKGSPATYNRYRHAKVLHQGEWVTIDGCWAGAPAKVPSYHGTVARTGKGTTISKKVVRQKASRTAKRVKGVRARSRK